MEEFSSADFAVTLGLLRKKVRPPFFYGAAPCCKYRQPADSGGGKPYPDMACIGNFKVEMP